MSSLIDSVIAGTPWGAWLIASPFKSSLDAIEGIAVNWLTNRGLIIFDVGAVIVDGKINEAKLTNALNEAFDKLKVGRDKITPQQGAKIDADTTKVFDDFADIPVADGMSVLPDNSV